MTDTEDLDARIEAALRRLGEDNVPPAGWQKLVLDGGPPLTGTELAEVVADARCPARHGADADTTLRLVRELLGARVKLAAADAFMAAHEAYDNKATEANLERRFDTLAAMRAAMRRP